jgi:ribosomal 50S subunit-recycling heat shock protein
VRVDLALKRLTLVKSRSEAKEACEVGAVFVNDVPAKPSAEIAPGDRLRIHFARRTLEVELVGLPEGNVSRARAHELVRVLRDERGE